MKSIETRLKDLEDDLNLDNDKAIVLIIDDDIESYKSPNKYFSDVDEREQFLNWRTKMVREENRFNPAMIYLYGFDEEDVLKHLEAFRQYLLNNNDYDPRI